MEVHEPCRATPERWGAALDYVRGKKRAEEALGFLTACGEELSSTLDCAASLPRVAALCVPYLGDACRISAAPDPAAEPVVAMRHVGRLAFAQATDALDALVAEPPPAPVAYTDVAGVPGRAGDAELARVRAAGLSSALVQPIASRGNALGTFALGRTPARDPIDAAAVALAAEVCRRLAAAIELAHLHASPVRA